MRSRIGRCWIPGIACLLVVASTAGAAPPEDITYQGRLLDSVGAPLAGPVAIEIAIYSQPTGGYLNTASGNGSSVSGGWNNTASGDFSSVSGGTENTASATSSSVSGGTTRSVSGTFDWRAGSLFENN